MAAHAHAHGADGGGTRRHEDLLESERGTVLVLYTGGTIGMKDTGGGFEPAPGFIHETLADNSMFHDQTFGVVSASVNGGAAAAAAAAAQLADFTFVTPTLKPGKRAVYKVTEYNPIVDSCNMRTADWVRIARDIEREYNNYDAFIVLHGTDTMAYTASALSFMLQNLSKTVVVTGSQIPVSVPLNDGLGNLLGALTIAAHYETPEVLLYFNGKAMRGNRTTKGNASGLDGFVSANFRPLIELGVDYRVDWSRLLPPPTAPFRVNAAYDGRVSVFRLFPGFSVESLRNVLRPPLRGLVLHTFGAGNAPDEAVAVLSEAAATGVIVVNVTQCQQGMVEAHYAVGVALRAAGVTPGYDMTVEAALTKLGHLLGTDLTPVQIRAKIEEDMRGELTSHAGARFSFKDGGFVSSIYHALHQQETGGDSGSKSHRAKGEMTLIANALYPVVMCSAAAQGLDDELSKMLASGADVNAADYDNRTPLHLAAAEGRAKTCALLLASGANVNVRDRAGLTPLLEAVRGRHIATARVLQEANGVLHLSAGAGAHELLLAAAANDAALVDMWCEFGVSADAADYDSRTAGHIAASEGFGDVLAVLQAHAANFDAADRWGTTARVEVAKFHPELVDMLTATATAVKA